jgi:hypothetical protein
VCRKKIEIQGGVCKGVQPPAPSPFQVSEMNASHAFENAALTSYLPTMTPAAGMNASSNKCMMEVIQIVSAHTADVLVHIMKIISEKYDHSIPEMMEVVRTHPAFHAIQLHPILTTDFFNVPAVAPVVAAAPAVPVPVLAPKKVTKIVRKKTDAVASTPAVAASPVANATAPVPAPTPAATPAPIINGDIPSPKSISPPISPLSQVVIIESPTASTVIDVSPPTTAPASPQASKKATVVIKKKEPVIEADKKEVKPYTY